MAAIYGVQTEDRKQMSEPTMLDPTPMFDRDTKEVMIGFSAIIIFALALTFLQPAVASWLQN
jgi:hypothetical protein